MSYLCALVNRYFREPVSPQQVLWSYSGVRPLLADESADPTRVTRDYHLELDAQPAPLLPVVGGKFPTYRRLAEEAVDRLGAALGQRGGPWTAGATLPGGDLPEGSFAVFLRTIERRYPWLPPRMRLRCAHAYGTRLEQALGGARALRDLGEELLPGLYEREVEYLCREEFARSAEDILWRRTKLGLHLLQCDPAPLKHWLEARHRSGPAVAPR